MVFSQGSNNSVHVFFYPDCRLILHFATTNYYPIRITKATAKSLKEQFIIGALRNAQ